ncbi:hypothetical protein CR155_08015 [Pollutimonas nitritireducens]|uniref:DUF4175 domain-containing protein n=1 Tax=Pollutimonas nitritireducens TaxID=2045209 RepID=A0A2N4UH86_9BURK|nr:hypothetical protein [Pollutimonas nitritireducens]PLC54368.1 hypothetical protein CR155_08015 [Pollutimonas nitritireducens]
MTGKRPVATWRLWGAPAVLGLLTCFGLLAALLGVDIWHWLAWLALAVPVATGAWFWSFPRRQRKSPGPCDTQI